MRTLRAFFAVVLACVLMSACGRKGDLLPPLARIPQKIESVTLSQRGDQIVVEWKNPQKYVDGTALAMANKVEIWVLEEAISDAPAAAKIDEASEKQSRPVPSAKKGAKETPLKRARSKTGSAGEATIKDFENKALLAASIDAGELAEYRKEKDSDAGGFSYPFSIGGKKLEATKLVFAVRVKDRRSRESEFSNPVSITPRKVPLPPQTPGARVLENGIEIRWRAPGANIDQSEPADIEGYNIYKEAEDGGLKCLNPSPVRELVFTDKDFAFGVAVRYVLRASASATAPYFESEDSEILEVLPEDVFPPAAPSALMPVPGRDFIALSWDANREDDLSGYKVWRRADGEEKSTLLTSQPLIINAFTDSNVEPGRRYLYAVGSVDRTGNESSKSEVSAETLKDELK